MSLELDEAGVCLLLPSAHCLAAKPVLKGGELQRFRRGLCCIGGLTKEGRVNHVVRLPVPPVSADGNLWGLRAVRSAKASKGGFKEVVLGWQFAPSGWILSVPILPQSR